jgi:hypothetical protein
MLRRCADAHVVLVLVLAACGGDGGGAGGQADGGAGIVDAAPAQDATACVVPDVLILLDRTLSMRHLPDGTRPADTPEGHAASKWAIAIAAVEAVVGDLGPTIRFGLALFPRDPGGDVCHTLGEVIQGSGAQNPQCEPGEVAVAQDDPDAAAAIGELLDPETTLMCYSTPIAGGLTTARDELARVRQPGRAQYVVFIGDGRDTCDAREALDVAQALARDGVLVHSVGFDASGGIDPRFLNNLACAGRTAIGFPDSCVANAEGDYLAAQPSGPTLYLVAADAASLGAALAGVASDVCCGCIE